jgi:hypothetical protein
MSSYPIFVLTAWIDGAVFEQLLGGRYSKGLQIGARHSAGCCLEMANEIARPHPCLLDKVVD